MILSFLFAIGVSSRELYFMLEKFITSLPGRLPAKRLLAQADTKPNCNRGKK
jgi:hypothetical protein